MWINPVDLEDLDSLVSSSSLTLTFFLHSLVHGFLVHEERDLMETSNLNLNMLRSLTHCIMSDIGFLYSHQLQEEVSLIMAKQSTDLLV